MKSRSRPVLAHDLAHALEEVSGEDVGLQCGARLRRHEEQRRGQVHDILHGLDLLRVGRIQHAQPREARLGRERRRQHVGTQARPTHAEHHGVGEPGAAHVIDEVDEPIGVRGLVGGDIEPAQPVLLARPGPHRGVAVPDPCHHVVVAPLPDGRIDLIVEALGKRSAHGRAHLPLLRCSTWPGKGSSRDAIT